MKRREFFKLSAPIVSAPFMLNKTMVNTFTTSSLFNSLDCTTIRDRFIVIIQLVGGNDGFNTVIKPEYYDNGGENLYETYRPNVFPEGTLLTCNQDAYQGINLHPQMEKIHTLCEQGAVNIIQSVGYPVMNRSHFKATDLWLTGGDGSSTENQNIQQGWMARYLENTFTDSVGAPSAFMPDPLGIQLRSTSQSLGFNTNTNNLAAINLSSKTTIDIDGQNEEFYANLSKLGISSDELSMGTCADRVGFMQTLDTQSNVYGQRITEVFNKGKNSVDYSGNHDLGVQLKTIAKLVNGGCKTKIFLTELGDFDTHDNQLSRHQILLNHLSESVHNFMEDLDKMGLLDRALIVTFSEFGRKIQENESGTDHGTLAPMFVFGHPDKIIAGVSGNPIFNTNESFESQIDGQDAPNVTADNHKDYRDVFSSILKQWLGADDAVVTNTFGSFAGSLSLVNNEFNAEGTPGCYDAGGEPENEVDIMIPIYESGILEDGVSLEQPFTEIAACDYVDLKPGFLAPCGSNVRIYPLDCGSNNNSSMAVFTQANAHALSTEDVNYTRIKEKKNEIQLIEKTAREERVRMNVFPNPAVDKINLTFSIREGEKKIHIELMDLKGAVIPIQLPKLDIVKGEYTIEISIQHLIPGYYYIRYASETTMETFKFVKSGR